MTEPRTQETFEQKSSILKKAQIAKDNIERFVLNNYKDSLEVVFATPWEQENREAEIALGSEVFEKQGIKDAEPSHIVWKRYEQKYGQLNEMIDNQKVVFEMTLDSEIAGKIEAFIQEIQTKYQVEVTEIQSEDTTEQLESVGMQGNVYHKAYAVVVK